MNKYILQVKNSKDGLDPRDKYTWPKFMLIHGPSRVDLTG